MGSGDLEGALEDSVTLSDSVMLALDPAAADPIRANRGGMLGGGV